MRLPKKLDDQSSTFKRKLAEVITNMFKKIKGAWPLVLWRVISCLMVLWRAISWLISQIKDE